MKFKEFRVSVWCTKLYQKLKIDGREQLQALIIPDVLLQCFDIADR